MVVAMVNRSVVGAHSRKPCSLNFIAHISFKSEILIRLMEDGNVTMLAVPSFFSRSQMAAEKQGLVKQAARTPPGSEIFHLRY